MISLYPGEYLKLNLFIPFPLVDSFITQYSDFLEYLKIKPNFGLQKYY